VQLLDAGGARAGILSPLSAPVTAMAFAPDGRLVCGQTIGTVEVWPAALTAPAEDPPRARRHAGPVWRTVVDRAGRYGRSQAGGSETLLWDLTGGQELTGTATEQALGRGMWFVPDGGAWLAVPHGAAYGDVGWLESAGRVVAVEPTGGGSGKMLRCWDLATGTPCWTWAGEPAGDGLGWWPDWIAAPPGGDAVLAHMSAAGDGGAVLTVLDLATGEPRAAFSLEDCASSWPQVLPDGSVYLSDRLHGGDLLRVRRLDWRSGTVENYAEVPAAAAGLVRPDGLVTALGGSEVTLYDPRRRQVVAAFDVGTKLGTASLSASAGGDVILAGDDQGSVHIFHVRPA
jgi:WD40 repeat protein